MRGAHLQFDVCDENDFRRPNFPVWNHVAAAAVVRLHLNQRSERELCFTPSSNLKIE